MAASWRSSATREDRADTCTAPASLNVTTTVRPAFFKRFRLRQAGPSERRKSSSTGSPVASVRLRLVWNEPSVQAA